jgi:hypothetical protein
MQPLKRHVLWRSTKGIAQARTVFFFLTARARRETMKDEE